MSLKIVGSVSEPVNSEACLRVCYMSVCLSSCLSHVSVRYKRTSLKILGSVGEPINPEAWLWYYNVVGDARCAIVDTFWQTETVCESCLLATTGSAV